MKIRKLGDLSLSSKMMIVITLVCLVLFAGNYVILQRSYRAYDNQLYVHTAQVYTSFVEHVETEVSQINNITLSMIGNQSVQEYLETLRDSSPGSLEWIGARTNLNSSIRSYTYGISLFSSFSIWMADGTRLGNKNDVLTESDKEDLIELARQAQGQPQIVLRGGHIYYARQIRDKNVHVVEPLGTMIAMVNIQKLMENGSDIYAKSGIGLNLAVDVENTRIYASGDAGVQQMETDGWQIQGDYFVVQCSNAWGWRFLLYTPYDEIHRAIRLTEKNSLWLTACIAATALLCSYYLVKRSTRHLSTLMEKIDAYRDGVLPSEKEMQRYKERNDEFGRIHRHFDRMAYDYKKLNDENYNYMILQKEAQYKQLQQQIQPHFIFNTMSLITWIAYEHEDAEIANISTSMSRLLRASMSFDEKTVRVRSELKLVEDYMLIQTKRFGNRLQYEMCVPTELHEVLIPHLTIQPIVENAIKYALEEMLDPCVIRICGWKEGNTAVLAVEDNGPGIDADILDKLQNSQITAKGNGIGLQNIQKRIQLLFSEAYGLQISRCHPGTQVQIRVPYQSRITEGG